MAALTEEQSLLRDQASVWVREQAPVRKFREMRDSGIEQAFAPDIWPKMVEMGWTGILIPEEYGGSNLGYLTCQWLKMTQLDLAYAVGYKSTGFISLVERGLKAMKAEMRKRAAEALGVHPWVLEWPEDLCDRKLQLLISFMRILQLPNETRQFIHD